MRVAFYAPLKPPDHPNPSGDRLMARLLIRALQTAGHEVTLASRFRSRDGAGNPDRQRRLRKIGLKLAARLIRRYLASPSEDRPEAWVTYHLYYKAPDWLGPTVSQALSIPYLLVEASYAPKRALGPWRLGHDATAMAVAQADTIICLNDVDPVCIQPLLSDPSGIVRLAPFLDAGPYAQDDQEAARRRTICRETFGLDAALPWLLTVAMMRPGDKLESYQVLGAALHKLRDAAWRLIVAGDGSARADVERALAPLGDRVRYLGQLSPDSLFEYYSAADLFVWPAVREAYGMALLEAQAAGLPVVAGTGVGVAAVVVDGETGMLCDSLDEDLFSEAVRRLLADPARRGEMSRAARRRVRTKHDLAAAARQLDAVLARAVMTNAT